jgi:hypothetical protein
MFEWQSAAMFGAPVHFLLAVLKLTCSKDIKKLW